MGDTLDGFGLKKKVVNKMILEKEDVAIIPE